jgi:hypothetical protein
MKKTVALVFVACFLATLAHFYFAEDHCPVHCPTRGGRLGHVHHHHPGAGVCLCFWSALAGPESGDLVPVELPQAVLERQAAELVLAASVEEITPPPRPFLPV